MSPRSKDTLLIVLRGEGYSPPHMNIRFMDSALGPGYSIPLILSLLPFLWCLSRLLFGPGQAGIHTFAAWVHMMSAAMFPWDVRGWDVLGHVAFLKKLDLTGSIPSPGECWECYQPPFYYLVNVLPFKLGRVLFSNPEIVLNPFTTILGIATIWIGLSALRRRVSEPARLPVQLCYSVFAVFTLMAGKPNNDVFVLLFSTIALERLWAWMDRGRTIHLALASICAALALLSKTTGLVTCGILFATILLRPFVEKERGLRRTLADAGTSLAIQLPIALTALWISASRASQAVSGSSEYVVGNIAIIGGGKLSNSLSLFLYPRLDLWFDSIGLNVVEHPFFWNALIKSCITGHSILLQPWSLLGYPLQVFSFGLMVAGVLSLLRFRKPDLLWFVPVFLCVAAVAAFRWKYPYVCSSDFRYVSFAALPACAGLTLIPLRILRPLAFGFAVSELLYFLGLYLQP